MELFTRVEDFTLASDTRHFLRVFAQIDKWILNSLEHNRESLRKNHFRCWANRTKDEAEISFTKGRIILGEIIIWYI